MNDTIIIGAGLAGLSTAHYLKSAYEVIEMKDHPGGLVVTHERDGFHFDVTGHWLHMRDPGIRRFINRLMRGRLVEVVRDSRIWSKGVETLYPFQMNTYGLPVETIKEIVEGFVATLMNPMRKQPKTFEQWVVKHMGDGIARHFMIPYNEKLWCAHPSEMTPLWCQHYIPKPTLDQILDGALRKPEEKIGYNATFAYPNKGGIGRLSEALASSLPQKRLHYNLRPISISAKKRIVKLSDGESVGYRNLVSSMPLSELIRLMEDAPPSVTRAASKLVCNQVLYYNIALNENPGSTAHWIYYPEAKYRFYRAGCYSNAVGSMAPKGKSCLYVEISHRGEVKPTAALWKKVLGGLLDAGLVRKKGDVLFQEAHNIPYAYVVFDANYKSAVSTIRRWLSGHGIHSIGRYGRWTYNSMESALIDGRETAKFIRNRK